LTLATLIRGEGVDVLLDADGLLSPGRFGILRRHCAPLQLQWLNVVDGWDRAGSHGDLCQSPVGSLLLEGGEAVSDAEIPDPTAGIVFAADVTLAELNSEVIALWSAILHAVPDATLVLRDYDFAHPETVDRLITAFGNYGVSHRIEIAQDKDGAAVFAGAHIALAPFPQLRPMAYAPALSQGVPVVLLNESATCNRFAQSLAALPHGADGISTSLAQYVDIATQWAKNPDALLSKRQALQMDCRQSPLFNATDMAARLEEHFRLCLSKIAQG
jgi:protein O-GlcNAc transferase